MPPLPPAPVDSVAASDLLGWVLGQSAALVVALLWILTMVRRDLANRNELQNCHARNALLSDYLCRTIESASREQSRLRDQHMFQLDSMQRSHADLWRQVLDSALTTPEKSAKRCEPETPL